MVVAGQDVAVLPEWVVTPYLAARRLVAVDLTARPVVRAWSCVTRREPPAHVPAFAELIRAHFADAPPA